MGKTAEIMNYIDYLRDGKVLPIPDTIQGTNYILKREPGLIISTGFFTKNNLKYVGDKIRKANHALDIKMDAFNNLISDYSKRLDLAFGITSDPNSLYLDSNWDINRITNNLLRP